MSGVSQRGGLYGDLTPMAIMIATTQGAIDGPILNSSGLIPRSGLSTAAAQKGAQVIGGTIATTSTSDAYLIVPISGSIASATITPLAALAVDGSNYLTWTITNLGQAGAGSTALLAATAANSTNLTGGSALSANTKRSFTLSATAADLVVVEGDLLLIRATATGTLSGAVTRPIYSIAVSGTT